VCTLAYPGLAGIAIVSVVDAAVIANEDVPRAKPSIAVASWIEGRTRTMGWFVAGAF
jgi:hypothetical protein